MFTLSSANAFNLVMSKILSFGKGLMLLKTEIFLLKGRKCGGERLLKRIVKKGGSADNKHFLLFSHFFYPVKDNSPSFEQ